MADLGTAKPLDLRREAEEFLGDWHTTIERERCAAKVVESLAELLAEHRLEAAAEERDKLTTAREMVKRFVVAQGPHLSESWRDALIKDCGLVEDALGFVTVPRVTTATEPK